MSNAMEWVGVIAAGLWSPLLSFIYLQIGLLVTLCLGFGSWRLIARSLIRFARSPGGGDANPLTHDRTIAPGRAFVSAIAGTVGVGNVAGVATAIHLGGPGALFWLWMSALFGMALRLASVWLAMRYRPARSDDYAFATPMAYLQALPGRSRLAAPVVAALIMASALFASLIQSNSVAQVFQQELSSSLAITATLMTAATAAVLLGGMRRIVDVCVAITPFMLLIYVGAGLLALVVEPAETAFALSLVFKHAFTPYSVAGGISGYAVLQAVQFGIVRGVFSHGSGLGMEPFLLAANDQNRPKAALLAAAVPLIDTMVVCSITALVVLCYGDWGGNNGAALTASAFESAHGVHGRTLIAISLVAFAFTSMINLAYCAERCFEYLGGLRVRWFRWAFLAVIFVGPFLPVMLAWSIADLLVAALFLAHGLPLLYMTLRHRTDILREIIGSSEPSPKSGEWH